MNGHRLRKKLAEKLGELRQELVEAVCRGLPEQQYWRYVGQISAIDDVSAIIEMVINSIDDENRRLD